MYDGIQGEYKFELNVSKNQNDFMKTPFGPKSNVIIVRISAILYNRAEILTIITMLFWSK